MTNDTGHATPAEPLRQRVAALIVAAGRGTRLGAQARASGQTAPKQYLPLGADGRAILRWTLQPFLDASTVDDIRVVIHQDDHALYADAVDDCRERLLSPVTGGATRQESVRLGLESLRDIAPDVVLIHDAARPFVTTDDIAQVLAAVDAATGAIVALPLADTLKRDAPGGTIAQTIPRAGLWRALTPQAFAFGPICLAHEAAARTDHEFTDDAEVAEAFGIPVRLVAGRSGNFKITTPEDYRMAEERIAMGMLPDVRTGTGFDVHRFAPGDHVWLCGVKIAHDARLDGHSDADVGLHALTDAILGAIGDGDIGAHFPPSDPQWKGAESHLFLTDAARRVRARAGRISNVDVTLLCEAPKIGPHRDAMRARIAQIIEIDVSRVGVKATTTEQLGFTGRREGIAAMASATVVLPAL